MRTKSRRIIKKKKKDDDDLPSTGEDWDARLCICEICGSRFKTISSLKTHKRRHVKIKTRPKRLKM